MKKKIEIELDGKREEKDYKVALSIFGKSKKAKIISDGVTIKEKGNEL